MGVKRKMYGSLSRKKLKRQIEFFLERSSFYKHLREATLAEAEDQKRKRDSFYLRLDDAEKELARRESQDEDTKETA